jgi:hypothetical protein
MIARTSALSKRWLHFEHELGELSRGRGRVEMIGPIRQKLLSGAKQIKEFQRLRDELRAFQMSSFSREILRRRPGEVIFRRSWLSPQTHCCTKGISFAAFGANL